MILHIGNNLVKIYKCSLYNVRFIIIILIQLINHLYNLLLLIIENKINIKNAKKKFISTN